MVQVAHIRVCIALLACVHVYAFVCGWRQRSKKRRGEGKGWRGKKWGWGDVRGEGQQWQCNHEATRVGSEQLLVCETAGSTHPG